MGNGGHQENLSKDTGHSNNTGKTHTDYQSEGNNNDISSAMDKKYGKRTRENMRESKRKCDRPRNLRIHPTINIEAKRYNILHTSTMVQTMGHTHLDLRYYARLHTTIPCGPN